MGINLEYIKSEIPESLINKCNDLADKTGDVYLIFDNKLSNIIKKNNLLSKEEERDVKINELLSDDIFHIGGEEKFKGMSSRWSYYDTETRLIGRYERYNFVVDFIKKIGFTPCSSNFGPEFEQSYTLREKSSKMFAEESWIIRLSPNLFIKIESYSYGSTYNLKNESYYGFFNKSKILNYLKKSNKYFDAIVRDIKIDNIISD